MNLSTQSKCPMCGGGRTHAEGTTSYGRCGSNWGPAWDTGVVKVFNQAPECRIGELENQMRNMVRLDDPVVTGLVEVIRKFSHNNECYVCQSERTKALSAYEARVKAIEPSLQNHGHADIDYKYNNETTTMSPARVKEVSRE